MKKKPAANPLFIFIVIVVAVFFGRWAGTERAIFGISFLTITDLVGALFINALTLVVVPLVSSSIITGIARIGNEGIVGRLGAKMFLFYIGTSLLAILIGLFFVNWIEPGNTPFLGTPPIPVSLTENQSPSFSAFLISIVPSNILAAFSKGEMLGLIFFSILFGYASSKIDKEPGAIIQGFFKGIFQTMIQVTHLIMKVLPLGVFCLVSKVFMTTGLESLSSLFLFTITVLLGFALFIFVGLPLLLKWIAKVKPSYHFKAMAPALVTAFSTSSSAATLPITMECVEKRAKVSNRICSLVIPLGTSINMSGSALYECVAAIFVAQAYGIELSFFNQFMIVLMALVTSIGVAGIPSASLVALIIILKVMGLPIEGIGLFMAVDRFLDMSRTLVNVFSDSCCAILVARTEGEKQVLAQDPSLL